MDSEKIKGALQQIRPALQADGGDIEFVSAADDGTVKVRLTGHCGSCPYALMTLKQTVENHLKTAVPGVKEVVQV